jgi:putative ABC transport system substrate-binding protein
MTYAEVTPKVMQTLRSTKDRDLRIDYRWVGADTDRLRLDVAELVKLREEAIIAVSTPKVMALQSEARAIPIVFTQASDQ